ncbi:hypothetical protein Tco_0915133 [Tanacetum coccineum]
MSMEALQAQEDLMKSIESFLKKFNRISFGKTPKVLLHAWDNFIEAKHAQPEEVQELLSKLVQDVKIISDELLESFNTPAWNRPLVYCDDDDDEDYTIAITPVLSTEEPVNSLIMEDEHLDTISATESDEFIKSSVEILIPIPSESKGVPKVRDSTSTDKIPFTSNEYEYLKASPPNSEPVSSKSPSTFPNLFLEETNTFDNSLPESETFCFNLEEPSSGSPTTHSELSLPDYKAFYIDNDHFKEKSSGSTTTHVDFSQYDSFIFDLSNDQFPPADRSDDFLNEKFADGLAHIISPPEYDLSTLRLMPELAILNGCVGNIFQESRTKSFDVLMFLPTLELDSYASR